MSPPKDKIIEPINDTMENVVEKLMQPAGIKSSNNNSLSTETPSQPADGHQYMLLDVDVEVETTVDGVEMGVLENGIPYLTQNGLAEACGIARSVVYDIAKDWVKNYDNEVLGNDRNSFLKEYLFRNGYKEQSLYIETESNGVKHHSYPDIVSMAVLEYYAFESKSDNKKARENYRKFAQYGLQQFIYKSVGYEIQDKWRFHNERQSILHNSVPLGYFSVFHEINALTLDLIRANLPVNDKTVPDASVGIHWAKYWESISHNHNERVPFPCNYPDSYRQSQANGYIEANAYPDSALPEFKKWFRQVYLPTKFPTYILTKAKMLKGGIEQAKKIGNLFKPKQLPKKEE